MKLATKRKHLPKTQGKTQQGEKPKKPKSVEEGPEKAHPLRRPLMIPNCKPRRTQPYSRVIEPGPYRPDRGADGRRCGRVGRRSPRVLEGSEGNGGQTPKRPSWGVLAVTEPWDEDQAGGGRGVPNQVELREREDRSEITTFRRCRPYRTVIQEDSAIPGSRATGATTSTITRDCDQPIDERKGLQTVQNAKRGREASGEKGGSRAKRPLETRTPGPKDMIRQVRGQGEGAAHGACGRSSLKVREWMLTMNSHGVEILIAGYIEVTVRYPYFHPSECPYTRVLPSTLTLCDSCSRVT